MCGAQVHAPAPYGDTLYVSATDPKDGHWCSWLEGMLEEASLPGSAQQPSGVKCHKNVRSINQGSFLSAHDFPERSLACDAADWQQKSAKKMPSGCSQCDMPHICAPRSILELSHEVAGLRRPSARMTLNASISSQGCTF